MTTDNRSAAWHYREAERLLHSAIAFDPDRTDTDIVVATAALAHAKLAEVGAVTLNNSPYSSPARQRLIRCVEGRDTE